jgi:hypothetical protein
MHVVTIRVWRPPQRFLRVSWWCAEPPAGRMPVPARVGDAHVGGRADGGRHGGEDVQVAADGRDGAAVLTADGKREAIERMIDFARRHVPRPSRFRQNRVIVRPGRR